MALISRKAHRSQLRDKAWSVIRQLIPGNALHMVVGDSGAGKTTWLLQALYAWEHQQPILGFESYPCPWVYVSMDRATWETDATLQRIGLTDWDAPIFSIEEITNTAYGFSIDAILNHPRFAEAKLFVIEGLQALIPSPGPRQSQNQAEMQWMIGLRQHLLATNRTIIAVTHPPKSKRGDKMTSGRSEVLGSQSLGATAGTMIKVEQVYDEEGNELDQRCVTFDGRGFRKFAVIYDIDENGCFKNPSEVTHRSSSPKQAQDENIRQSIQQGNLDVWLASMKVQPLKTENIVQFAESQGISRATARRWIDSAIERGILAKLSFGMYQKTLILQ